MFVEKSNKFGIKNCANRDTLFSLAMFVNRENVFLCYYFISFYRYFINNHFERTRLQAVSCGPAMVGLSHA